MKIRTKLEDLGVDTDEKEMYELCKFIYLEAQKDLLRDILENDVDDFNGYNAISERTIERRLKEIKQTNN